MKVATLERLAAVSLLPVLAASEGVSDNVSVCNAIIGVAAGDLATKTESGL